MRTAPRTRRGPRERAAVKAYVASLSGTSLEYYDFALYSVASALVLPTLFFPRGDDQVALLLSFSTFAVGYLARPLGGVVFGRLGDRVGRRKVLVATLLLVGTATVLIGLLPTYDAIGFAAPAVLVALRLAQGVGVGGEWGGAVLLAGEFGSPRRRGFWSSAAQGGPPVGNLLANGVLALLAGVLSEEDFLAWGWRIAFLASALLIAFGLSIRLRLEETPVFRALVEQGERPEKPLTELLSAHRRALVAAGLSRLLPDVLYSLLTVYLAVHATRYLGLTTTHVLTAVLVGSAVQALVIPAAGLLTDRFNRRRVYAVATAAAAVYVPVLFAVQDGTPLVYTTTVAVGLGLQGLMYGPQAALITEQFPARLRYGGSSLAYTVAGVFGGAVAPLVLAALAGDSGEWHPIAGYLALAAVLTLVGVALCRDGAPEEDERLTRGARA